MDKKLTREDVAALLRFMCVPTQKKWADQHGLSVAYVSDVLRGAREPGPGILRALGLEKEEAHYKKVQA